MSRIKNKYFYILLICVAMGLGLFMPLWLILHVWEFPLWYGILFYVTTAGAAIIATLILVHASNHLEIKEAHSEH